MSQSNASKIFLFLRIGLLVVMMLLLAAMLYDYRVARLKPAEAYDKVNALNDQRLSLPVVDEDGKRISKGTSRKDIQKLLGKKPSEVKKVGHYHVEVYSWMGGLPWKSYKYYVVYGRSWGMMRHYALELKMDELRYKLPEKTPEMPPDPVDANGS